MQQKEVQSVRNVQQNHIRQKEQEVAQIVLKCVQRNVFQQRDYVEDVQQEMDLMKQQKAVIHVLEDIIRLEIRMYVRNVQRERIPLTKRHHVQCVQWEHIQMKNHRQPVKHVKMAHMHQVLDPLDVWRVQ